MKQLLRGTIATLITLAAITGAAFAQDRGTPAEAKQMVERGLAHIKEVGTAKAFEDFSAPTGKWHNKDIFIFCYKSDGTCACSGGSKGLIGKNLNEMKYLDGQLHTKIQAEIANTKGSGWDEYPWPNPISKKIETKQSFVAKVPGWNGFIAAGAYK